MRPADERLMGLALALGRRNLGLTWPNPSVGAVLVDEGSGPARIIAQGVTARGGRPHAEPLALAAAGASARGATLFVSLEPCSHHGRTPPCVDAVVAAGIARVVSAMADPDPRVAGRGHAALRAAGIDVASGVGTEEAERAHGGHVTRIRLGRPAVTVKLARTADGFAAGRPEASRLMITGEGAEARTHLLRAHADAVLVGVSTIVADDPRLDVRLPGLADRSPLRVVVDSRLRLPPTSRVVATARERPTWIVCAEDADPERETLLAEAGAVVIRAARDESGRVDLASAMGLLGQRGLTRVLCEGGPTLAEALAAHDLVDEICLLTGQAPLGGTGLRAIGERLGRSLARMDVRERLIVGQDTIEHFERASCSPGS